MWGCRAMKVLLKDLGELSSQVEDNARKQLDIPLLERTEDRWASTPEQELSLKARNRPLSRSHRVRSAETPTPEPRG